MVKLEKPLKLGVNIDHIATLRQARLGAEPNVCQAAREALLGGADGITVHLREDRRHIQDHDVFALRRLVPRLNLEMAVAPDIVEIACTIKPNFCCLVPEKREELTTEGGLDVVGCRDAIRFAVDRLHSFGIQVSLFIDSDPAQIHEAKKCSADYIELHTGVYAQVAARQANEIESQASTESLVRSELETLLSGASLAQSLGLKVNAGHGLNYDNVLRFKALPMIEELNIGHSIVSRAVFVGLKEAVQEMKALIS